MDESPFIKRIRSDSQPEKVAVRLFLADPKDEKTIAHSYAYYHWDSDATGVFLGQISCYDDLVRTFMSFAPPNRVLKWMIGLLLSPKAGSLPELYRRYHDNTAALNPWLIPGRERIVNLTDNSQVSAFLRLTKDEAAPTIVGFLDGHAGVGAPCSPNRPPIDLEALADKTGWMEAGEDVSDDDEWRSKPIKQFPTSEKAFVDRILKMEHSIHHMRCLRTKFVTMARKRLWNPT